MRTVESRRLTVDFMVTNLNEFMEERRAQDEFFKRLAESNEWYTPMSLFKDLGVMFDLDAAASPHKRTPAERHYTMEDNGLRRPWEGLVWLSPPVVNTPDHINNPRSWLKRMYDHHNGILLRRATTDTKSFHEFPADAYLFLKGRIRFVDSMTLRKLNAGTHGSVLCAYGEEAVRILAESAVDGMLLMPYA